MATVVATTTWSHTAGQGSPFNVTLTHTATAGNKLILATAGGAIATVTGWAKRTTYGGGAQDVSWQDTVATGGETTVSISLNGPDNVDGVIYEVNGLGAFIGASNNGTGSTAAAASDYQIRPTTSVNITGNATAFGLWSVTTATPFSVANRWRQMGPAGKLYANAGNQPGANTQFIWASGIADVTAAKRWPESLTSAGDYRATSVYIGASAGMAFAAQALYADTSGVATNPAAANPIVGENSLPGSDNSNWFLGSNGTNSTIAGYCDKTSYAPGDTVNFKVDSTGNPWRAEIYRLGFYGWETFGARSVLGPGGSIAGTVVTQPAPTVDGTLGSTSCAWTTNASWVIPTDATPGVYYVLFRRTDVTSNVASGHFIVRGTAAGKVAVVIPEITYQAYNVWGATTDHGDRSTGVNTGRSLYQSGADGASPNFAHRSYGVSFDRPYSVQATQPATYLFDAEQPWICWAEAQGYNLTYLSSLDLDGNTTLLNGASLIALIGHHEYWTTAIYDCVTHAVDAGVPLFVDSSNTALWRTRFAAADTAKRTVICYKDSGTADVSAGWSGTGYDPVSYTGTWRDSRTGGLVNNVDIRREDALTGQLFVASGPVQTKVTVPFGSKSKPLWRNSAAIQALTTGQTYTTVVNALGYEVDYPSGGASQPTNLVQLNPGSQSFTTGANAAGTVYSTSTGAVTVTFTLYRRASGALVFNSGSWRGWWGVTRWAGTGPSGAISVDWQNALLAILYDLGATPATLTSMQPGQDTAVTDPATGAPGGGRPGVAVAYGLTVPSATSSAFLAFFT